MSRYRSWCFTVNNYSDVDEAYVFQLAELPDFTYVVCGREVGEESQVPHLQGHVYFKNMKSMKQVAEMLPRAHLMPSRGTSVQNRLYCSKGTQPKDEWEAYKELGPNYGRDADVYEYGHIPYDSTLKGLRGKEAFEHQMGEALELVRAGNIDDVPVNMTHHLKAIQYRVEMENVSHFDLSRLVGPLPHVWICGPAGLGKSLLARDPNPDAYIKSPDRWWNHYSGEGTVIIEDVDRSHAPLLWHLKVWSDRYPFPAEFKGGSFKAIRPRKVIVTSNWHPTRIWPDPEDHEPILRRFHFIDLQEKTPEAIAKTRIDIS